MSTIMSSWPPTSRRRPSSIRMSRTSTPYVLGGVLGVAQEAGVDAGVAEGQRLAVDPDRAVLQRADEVVGGVLQREQVAAVLASPCRSATAMNASSGQLPAPAPCPASEASTRLTPSSTATTELATASDRFWWAWMPISVSGSSTSR